MKFMFHWRIQPQNHEAAAKAFLESQAPMPAGLSVVGRWHAPGSSEGWLLAEADDLAPVTQHAADWASLLEVRVIPVVDDEAAGKAFATKYG